MLHPNPTKTVIPTGNQLHGWKNFPAIVWWVFYWNLPWLIIFPWKTASWRGFLGDFPIQTSIECGISHASTVALSSCRLFGKSHPQALVFNSDQIRVKYTSNWTHIQIVRFPRLEIGSSIYLWYSLIYTHTHIYIYTRAYIYMYIYVYNIYTYIYLYIYICVCVSLSLSLSPPFGCW